MASFKTTKVVDKLIADEWKKVIIPVQHMFPNCQVKYKTKCTDMKSCSKDKEFWDKVKDSADSQIAKATMTGVKIIKDVEPIIGKTPKYFQEDIERAKRSKV